MILLNDIKQFMATSKTATLGQLLDYFALNETNINDLKLKLKHWIDKGCLIEVACTLSCGKQCEQCVFSKLTKRYQWIQKETP